MKYISRLFGAFFIISSFIPWLGIPSLDSQPFPVIFSTVFLLINYKNSREILANNNYLVILLGLAIFGWIFGLLLEDNNPLDFIAFRALYNYLGFIILIIGYLLYFKLYSFPLNILIILNILWLFIGIFQSFDPTIVSSFIYSRTSDDRGVTSLATEPSFFGIFLFFISWIYLIRFKYRCHLALKFLLLINILSIMILAKSSLVMLYILLVIIILYIFLLKISHKIYSLSAAIILLLFFSLLDSEIDHNRVMHFISIFISDPFLFFSHDASANQRLANIILPIHGLIENYLLPGGFHNFTDLADIIVSQYGDYFFYSYGDIKIMSWLGAVLYELGLFGLIIIVIVLKRSYSRSNIRFLEILIMIILLFSAIPVAFPLIPFIFSMFIYDNNIGEYKK